MGNGRCQSVCNFSVLWKSMEVVIGRSWRNWFQLGKLNRRIEIIFCSSHTLTHLSTLTATGLKSRALAATSVSSSSWSGTKVRLLPWSNTWTSHKRTTRLPVEDECHPFEKRHLYKIDTWYFKRPSTPYFYITTYKPRQLNSIQSISVLVSKFCHQSLRQLLKTPVKGTPRDDSLGAVERCALRYVVRRYCAWGAT